MKIRFHSLAAAMLCVACGMMTGVAKADPLGDLTFITENYAPYNYAKDGEVQGTTIDLLLRIFEQAGTSRDLDDIEVMNWARGYQLAQDTENTVLFSTTRTKTREDMFKWVGPISPTRIVIIGKKDSGISVSGIEDLNRYRIGAVRADIGELLILNGGVREENVDRTNSSSITAKMLIADRIDLWAYEESVARFNLREQGADPEDYEVLLELEKSHLYFAIQKDTDDALIARLQAALDKAVEATQ